MYSIWETLSLNEEVPSGAESQAPDVSSLQEDHLDHWRHIKTRWKPPQLQRQHVRNTHYPASRSQCFASTSRNTTQLHTISSTTQMSTLAKANACQLARDQETFIRVFLKLPSHKKPLSQHKITLMMPVRITNEMKSLGTNLPSTFWNLSAFSGWAT